MPAGIDPFHGVSTENKATILKFRFAAMAMSFSIPMLNTLLHDSLCKHGKYLKNITEKYYQ